MYYLSTKIKTTERDKTFRHKILVARLNTIYIHVIKTNCIIKPDTVAPPPSYQAPATPLIRPSFRCTEIVKCY